MDEQNKNISEEKKEEGQGRFTGKRLQRGGAPWVGGAVLILIGIVFLLQNTTGFYLNNWWAFFILIPAIGAFGNAWRAYQDDDKLSARARGSLIGGLVMTLITAIFLFNLDWVILGPVILILAGVALLLNSLVK